MAQISIWCADQDLMVGTLEEEELVELNVQQLEYRSAFPDLLALYKQPACY